MYTEPTPSEQTYWIEPTPEIRNAPRRQVPVYEEPAPSVRVEELHAPVPVEPVAPIIAPADKLRAGDFILDNPGMSKPVLDRTNNTLAAAEAGVGTVYRSVGIEASRSDRVAGATIAGVVGGGLVGATAAGVPAALIGGTLGGGAGAGIGATVGAGMGAVTVPVIGAVPGIAAGAAVGAATGAAAGAAAVGIPFAIGGAIVGGALGGAAGTAFGAGDTRPDPIELDLPALPSEGTGPAPEATAPEPAPAPFDTAAVTAGTAAVVEQVESMPGGSAAIESVRAAADQAPAMVEHTNVVAAEQMSAVRTAALAGPGGSDAVAAVDAAVAHAAPMVEQAVAPIATQVGDVLAAAHAGLTPAATTS
ncbi:hypothetical protein ACFTZB_08060 [Rhodococcus sp. NPDC057014]|uniref:hypothetical protein n=1 Tax=Rhodococcus sp. NPDC057014 TaxID=3346000 RepID=UPI00363CE351